MNLKFQLLLLYARDFLVFSTLISLLTYYLYYRIGNGALTTLIWFKLITSIIGIVVHQGRKSKELFFYLNNGLGKKALMLAAAGGDFILWMIGIILLINYRS
jgi:hypothetical protein